MAEKKDFPVFRVGIVTLSDKGYQGEREDKSGPKIKELLPELLPVNCPEHNNCR